MAESSSAVASTSTSTAANTRYDVFINHRGPDVKKTFASHLYRALLSRGLRVFLDQPELHRGECFICQIEDVIRSASVHVAIFSPGYADSIWCLNELVQMLDSKAPTIPVFYGVKPTELRRTRGKKRSYVEAMETRGKTRSYAEALEKLEKKTEYDPQTHEQKLRYDSIMIENWRTALSKVADISGFELEACNSDEGELVDRVVEWVLKKVKKPALGVAQHPIGLDDKVKDFKNSVVLPQQQRGKPQIFGIVGLGGVGKTTLAKEFFNKNSSDYYRNCFLSDVRDSAAKGTLNLLQTELLKNLTESGSQIANVHEGIGILKKHISSRKVLVILDDVDKVEQVSVLLPDQTLLDSDSLILITSRNKDVLINSGVQESSIYNLTGLTTQHSLELFCLHSFNQSHPAPEFESLVNKFVEACGGLPLSLRVFGALLKGKNISYWEHQLNKLRRILPKEIKQRLQISYDALDREQKEIFLDIACFFNGEEIDMAIRIWDNGFHGFQDIQDKCLVDIIEVDGEKKIKMHDQLRDMGREIAQDSGLPRRLWRWTENDIDNLLQQSSDGQVPAVRGIRMADNDIEEDDSGYDSDYYSNYYSDDNIVFRCHKKLEFADNAFGDFRMRRLQFLDSEHVLVEHILEKVQFPNLIWLRWKSCPLFSLPSSISMKSLRVLEVQGSVLETLWENESQAPLQLRELRIDAPLSNIPTSIGRLKHLERIVIQRILISPPATESSPLVTFTKLPEEFCLLESLKALVLKSCQELKSLPECFGNLTNLEQIELSWCPTLKRLPKSFGNLTKLEQIELSWCPTLKRLPKSFGNLTNLQQINLSGCGALGRLPHSFCKLSKLQYLYLGDCVNLTMSSKTLGNIRTLQYINLTRCGKIEKLPPQVAHQRSLKQLSLVGTNLKELPSVIGELSDLEVLAVGVLDTVPLSVWDLKNLEELELRLHQCEEFKCLPDSLDDFKNLKKLTLWGFKELKCLPASLGLLTQLTNLSVGDCPLISELPFKKEVKGERELDSSIHNCILPRLQHLSISVTGISEVSFAEGVCFNLRSLGIESCNNLVEVGTLPNTLINLHVINCHNLRKIDKISGLPKLDRLIIRDCIELEELPRIETWVSLRRLDASGCVKLKSIRGLGQIHSLIHSLQVRGCSELEELEGVQHSLSLGWLDVRECPKLQWSAGVVEQLRQIDLFFM